MSNLESYILKRYGRFVPFEDCTSELLFDVTLCLAASVKKECTGGTTHKPNYRGELVYHLTPQMMPVEYTTERFCIANESIDYKNNGLLYTVLARLLMLNLHLDQKE